ncbi:hypothetical protein CPB86DRAFT_289754 [Serendipita vermifera]|nr:hypothetical protein CPB86DRAFT_289754 [Serendipita vermifera]
MYSLHSKAANRLPIEIWEYILDDVMDNTLLLSTTPLDYRWEFARSVEDWICTTYCIDGSKRVNWMVGNQPAMREYKRTIANLRLVCQFWKRYAESNRAKTLCARLTLPSCVDVDLSSKDVSSAKRIEVVTPSQILSSSDLEPDMKKISTMNKRFAAEILVDIGGTVTNTILRSHHHLFPRLTALHVDLRKCPRDSILRLDLEETLPKLVSLTCLSLSVDGEARFPTKYMHLPKLSTLVISAHRYSKELSMEAWHIPSLQHLYISGTDGGPPLITALKHIAALNPNLHTLSLIPYTHTHERRKCQCYEALWAKHDQLTRLQIPILSILHHKVPDGHPLTHIVNTGLSSMSHSYIQERKEENILPFYAELTSFCLSARRLRVITDNHDWHDIITKANTPLELLSTDDPDDTATAKEILKLKAARITMIVAQKLHGLYIRYEDRNNLTLEEVSTQYAGEQICFG